MLRGVGVKISWGKEAPLVCEKLIPMVRISAQCLSAANC